MEEQPAEKKKEFIVPSYSGVWVSENLYLEVGIVLDGTFVRLRNKNRDVVAEFLFEDFAKKVRALKQAAQKLSKM